MKLWAGRTGGDVDERLSAINNSIGFDSRMYRQDITGSIAHARMLGRQGIISGEDAAQIVEGLRGILADIDSIIDDSAVRLIGIVPEDFALSLAAIAGDPIKENSVSAQAFDRIAHRLLGENVPLNFKGMK